MKPWITLLAAVAPISELVLTPRVAHAELDACGGVFVDANASCEFHKTQDCVETCKTVSVEESCTAHLYTMCDSQCTAQASAMCTQTCSPSCMNECTTSGSGESSDEL